MCDFPVITRFGCRSLCDNRIKSRSMVFYFGWRVLPCFPWGKEVPWLCVGEAATHGAKKPHAKEAEEGNLPVHDTEQEQSVPKAPEEILKEVGAEKKLPRKWRNQLRFLPKNNQRRTAKKHPRRKICWHYDACVVLDGNPLIEEYLTYV